VLARRVVDLRWWLDSSGDDEIDPDTAVKMMESVTWVLNRLPPSQRDRFLVVLDDLADTEPDPARRRVLQAFPFASGLVDDEPARPAEPWTAWVHPAARTNLTS
jgi:hypothetical protein